MEYVSARHMIHMGEKKKAKKKGATRRKLRHNNNKVKN
jgi:hypothetical protein